mmetsp:Transcript_22643/g.53469  ORF Transcript_22643/g.53469 Transcript_22643/m.53469 type:complete len:378 (-) Transcript_22643:1102-2235(-)
MKVDVHTSSFLAWSDAKGISTPLELVSDGNYRSMRIPSAGMAQTLVDESTASKGFTNIVQVPLDACIIGDDLPTLVEKLKYEKSLGDVSTYAPWLNLFPTLDDFKDMPRFWTQDRLDFVKRFDGGQLEARMEIDEARINKCDDPWALAIVDSRTNYLPDETYSLTPMLDMFNHDATFRTTGCVEEDLTLKIDVLSNAILESATADSVDWKDQVLGFFKGNDDKIKQGDEVFISYGDFDNVELLSNYGFCTAENTANIEQFKVRSLGMGTKPALLVVDNQGNIDNLFNTMSLDSLRLSLATPSELEEYDGTATISDRNEEEMYALIAGELEEAVYDAKAGISEAELRGDMLVATYLKGRFRTLESGLNGLKEAYPDLF